MPYIPFDDGQGIDFGIQDWTYGGKPRDVDDDFTSTPYPDSRSSPTPNPTPNGKCLAEKLSDWADCINEKVPGIGR